MSIAALFIATTIQLHLPSGLLSSICYVETKHSVHKVHYNDGNTHSYGICQIKLETSQGLGFKGTTEDLMQPETNIWYAGLYLQYQIKRYKHDIRKAVIAYNKGNAKGLTYSEYQGKVFNKWSTTDNERTYRH